MGAAWLWIGLLVLFAAAAVSDFRHRAARRVARSLDPGISATTRRQVDRAEHETMIRLADKAHLPGGFNGPGPG